MTTSPEAFLAAEAEIAYACMAHVTDYDVWHAEEAPVTVDMVMRILHENTALAKAAITSMVETMGEWDGDFPAHHTLSDAIITDRTRVSASAREKLAPLVANYLD